jgi:hypothetical protein
VTQSRLRYPVATKADFVDQMSRSPQVVFRGVTYDMRFAAGLVPRFFFPIESAEDLVGKATELLAARGLAAEAPPAGDPGPRRVAAGTSLDAILAGIEGTITDASIGETDRRRIEALDVVTHALEFVGHPDALNLWRGAAAGRFPSDVKAAVAAMLEYMSEAIGRGDLRAVSEVCDCLFALYDPTSVRKHVGGHRKPLDRPPVPARSEEAP